MDAYSIGVSTRVYEAMLEKCNHVLGAGHSVVVDAVFSKPDERKAIEAVAMQREVSFFGFWLDVGADELCRRVAARRNDVSDATIDVVRGQLARGAGQIDWQIIDAAGKKEDTLARLVQAMRSRNGGS